MTTGRELPAGGRYSGGGELAVPDRVTHVVRGDTITHGAWTSGTQKVIEALDLVKRFQDAMVSSLTAVDASESQINDVTAWSDHVTVVTQRIRDGLQAIDDRLRPYVNAVDRAGGPSEVGSPGYHADY
jgi:hypothetical protein